MNLVSSVLDVNHLDLIPSSVSKVQREMYELLWDDAGCRILDVAPQAHGAFTIVSECIHNFSSFNVDTKSGASYVHDLCELLPDTLIGMFGVVVCSEFHKQIRQPVDAAKFLLGMVSTGGNILVTTPCNVRILGSLPDCWRFTQHGSRELFKSASFISIPRVETLSRPLFPIGHQTLDS